MKYVVLRAEKVGGVGFTVELDEAHLHTNRRRIGRCLAEKSIGLLLAFVGILMMYFSGLCASEV